MRRIKEPFPASPQFLPINPESARPRARRTQSSAVVVEAVEAAAHAALPERQKPPPAAPAAKEIWRNREESRSCNRDECNRNLRVSKLSLLRSGRMLERSLIQSASRNTTQQVPASPRVVPSAPIPHSALPFKSNAVELGLRLSLSFYQGAAINSLLRQLSFAPSRSCDGAHRRPGSRRSRPLRYWWHGPQPAPVRGRS